MEYEKNICPVLDVDGILATGKQFDLDITLPEDNRSVIYGVVKDCYQEPVCEAVVKLVEVVCECGKEERRPVSHTFTDEDGEFVFGPLCANRSYEIEIWVDRVKHCKVCTKVERDGNCLKGVKLDCKKECHKPCHKKDCDDKCYKYEDKYDDKCDKYEDKFCKDCCEKEDKCRKEHCEKEKEDKCCKEHCEKEKEDKCCKECCEKEKECKEDKECDKKDNKCERRPERPYRPCGRIF